MKLGITSLFIAVSAMLGLFGALNARAAVQQPSAPASIWDGIYTEEQAKRGLTVYTEQCTFCHGDSLTDGTQAPPLAGDEFLTSWKGNTLEALFEKMSEMMPPTDPGSLTKEQCADVLAYMLNVGKVPAGTAELKGEKESLKQIRIEPKPEGQK